MASTVLGVDAKRLHTAHEMRRARDGAVSAQQEIMYLCVDLGSRRVAAFPEPFAAGLRQAARDHADLARPDWVGRRISMPQ